MRLTEKSPRITGAGSGIASQPSPLPRHGATVVGADLQGAGRLRCGRREQGPALIAHRRKHGGLRSFSHAGVSGGLASIFDRRGRLGQICASTDRSAVASSCAPHLTPVRARSSAPPSPLRSGAGGPAYSASKAGVISLVKSAAQQLSGSNVRVNAICPGLVETGMTEFVYERARAKGVEERLGSLNPLKRGALPPEIASAALFLASDEASYVNGHALVVDGGLSSSHPFTNQSYGRTAI